MIEILGKPLPLVLAQLMLGLVNGAFYALLSLGLAVIFGLLNIVNFSHGAMYMMGAMLTWMGMEYLGLSYWTMLLLAPLAVGLLGLLVEWLLLRRISGLDPLYGLLLTFGLTLFVEGAFRSGFGVSGQPYAVPEALQGSLDLGLLRLPVYRAWVVGVSLAVCLACWWVIERTPLGALLRAGTENAPLTRAFGVNVPLMTTLTYAFGVGLAALAGVLAAPLWQVQPLMGSNMVVVVFAVVVIGGMGSISGAIFSGLLLGVVEGLTKVYYPQAASTIVFLVMAAVLLLRPAGLFGREA